MVISVCLLYENYFHDDSTWCTEMNSENKTHMNWNFLCLEEFFFHFLNLKSQKNKFQKVRIIKGTNF